MKKMLLFAAAAMVAASASAVEAVLVESDFSTMTEYQWWHGGAGEFSIKDGALVIENAEKTENFWDVQYFVADHLSVEKGIEYTIAIKIKGFSGTLHTNLSAWNEDAAYGGVEIEAADGWQTVTTSLVGANTTSDAHFILQSGDFVGSYAIENVKITYNKEEGGETPDDPVTPGDEKVLASFFDGSGAAFGGWGGSIEQVEEDGKPCLKYTNEEAKDFWATQIAIDLDYVIGETYYFSFDVKGTGSEEITSGFQYAGLNNAGDQVYWGCGNCTGFNATPDWTNVVIKGTTVAAEEGQTPGRWVANLGQYVGELYLTNVKVYTIGTSTAVETIAPVKVNTAVYNLHGVKVANSLDEVAAPGLYISNGKKVIKK